MYQFATALKGLYQHAKRCAAGQTMTEYALIMASVAIVVFVVYQTMGNNIVTVLNNVANDLTPAS